MKSTEGSIFKTCGCRDKNGKRLTVRCPKLKRRNNSWNQNHGNWAYQLELPLTESGTRRQARRFGIETRDEARDEINHIKNLLALANDDDEVRRSIASLIQDTLKNNQPLPQTKEIERKLNAGQDVWAEVPTVATWLQEWMAQKDDIEDSTRRAYQGHITNHLIPFLGHIRLDRLSVAHIRGLFEAIDERNRDILEARNSDDPKVRATVRGMRTTALPTKYRIRATLRKSLSDAIRRPDIPIHVNVASIYQLPSEQKARPLVWTEDRVTHYSTTGDVPSPVMVWTPEQTAQFLIRARRHRLYPIFHLIAFRGLRRGEAVGLPWANTRLTDHAIDINTQVVQLGWKTITSTPKSAAGQRTVTLDTETADVLKKWRRDQARERLKAGNAWTESGLVFTHPDGTPLHPASVTRLFQTLAAEAGLPPIRLHDLRHGAASMSLAAGVDIRVVSSELGHATTNFTQDVYQSVLPSVAREAAEATAKIIPLPPHNSESA